MRAAFVRLYPRSWRDRYGEEFEAMLEEQPTDLASVADVVLGAVDAHLTAGAPERRGWWLRRLPGLLIAVSAIVWGIALAIRQAGFDQEAVNVAPAWLAFGRLGVGLGVVALVGQFPRRPRWPAAATLATGVALAIGGIAISAVHVGGLMAPWFVDWSWTTVAARSSILAIAASQLAWVGLMLVRSTLPKAPLLAVAIASMAMLSAGQPGADPTSDMAMPLEVLAIAWFAIGLSLLRPARSPVELVQ